MSDLYFFFHMMKNSLYQSDQRTISISSSSISINGESWISSFQIKENTPGNFTLQIYSQDFVINCFPISIICDNISNKYNIKVKITRKVRGLFSGYVVIRQLTIGSGIQFVLRRDKFGRDITVMNDDEIIFEIGGYKTPKCRYKIIFVIT